MAPSRFGFSRADVDAKGHGALLEADHRRKRASSDVIQTGAATGGDVAHLVR